MIEGIPTPLGREHLKRKLVYIEETKRQKCDFYRHGTTKTDVIEYFYRIIGLVGCSKDAHVVCRAWGFVCRALGAASGSHDNDFRSVKAMVCACLSLAIEVSADFEADYVVSSAGWGHFFFCEITGHPHEKFGKQDDTSDMEEHCRALMRLKLVISSQFNWNLGGLSSADYFSRMIESLLRTSCCAVCDSMRRDVGKILPHGVCILRSLTCGLSSEGIPEQVIGIMAVVVVHETFQSRQASMTYPYHRIKRALRVTRTCLEDKGLCDCILEMAQVCLESAKPLLQARDLLMCEKTMASILEQPEYIGTVPIIRKIDSLFQSGSSCSTLS